MLLFIESLNKIVENLKRKLFLKLLSDLMLASMF